MNYDTIRDYAFGHIPGDDDERLIAELMSGKSCRRGSTHPKGLRCATIWAKRHIKDEKLRRGFLKWLASRNILWQMERKIPLTVETQRWVAYVNLIGVLVATEGERAALAYMTRNFRKFLKVIEKDLKALGIVKRFPPLCLCVIANFRRVPPRQRRPLVSHRAYQRQQAADVRTTLFKRRTREIVRARKAAKVLASAVASSVATPSANLVASHPVADVITDTPSAVEAFKGWWATFFSRS